MQQYHHDRPLLQSTCRNIISHVSKQGYSLCNHIVASHAINDSRGFLPEIYVETMTGRNP